MSGAARGSGTGPRPTAHGERHGPTTIGDGPRTYHSGVNFLFRPWVIAGFWRPGM